MNGFEKYDKPRMNQLPGESYTLCDYKYFLKVPDNYHLEYDANYYSVLYTYKGKLFLLKIKNLLKVYGKIELSRNYQPIHLKEIYLHDNI